MSELQSPTRRNSQGMARYSKRMSKAKISLLGLKLPDSKSRQSEVALPQDNSNIDIPTSSIPKPMKTKEEIEAELLKMNIALKKRIQTMLQDGLSEIYVDQLRLKVKRKEQNEKKNKLRQQMERDSKSHKMGIRTPISGASGRRNTKYVTNQNDLGQSTKNQASNESFLGQTEKRQQPLSSYGNMTFDDQG